MCESSARQRFAVTGLSFAGLSEPVHRGGVDAVEARIPELREQVGSEQGAVFRGRTGLLEGLGVLQEVSLGEHAERRDVAHGVRRVASANRRAQVVVRLAAGVAVEEAEAPARERAAAMARVEARARSVTCVPDERSRVRLG